MSTLICLGGGIEGKPILERAKALGHRLVVVDGNPNALGFQYAHEVCCASCYDAQDVLSQFEFDPTVPEEYAGPFDGVLCCAIDAPHVAAAVAQAFGLPGLTPAQAHLSVNKLAQKTALRAAGLPVPDFWALPLGLREKELRSTDDVDGLVVKPVDSRGARGIRLLRGGTFDGVGAILDAQEISPSGRAAVERYLPGPQLSTESIIQDGRVLFTAIGLRNYDRLAEFAPHIIEDGYDMPYGGVALQWEVGNLLLKACAALGWDNLTVKGDWIIHDGQLVILELAARLSGGFFGTHGIPLAYGVDFVGAAIQMALGERVSTPLVKPQWAVCQRYIFPESGDIGRRVKVVAPYLNTDFHTYAIHLGDIIQPVVSHGQRWGQATCTGATPEQARERAEQAVAAMKRAVVLE